MIGHQAVLNHSALVIDVSRDLIISLPFVLQNMLSLLAPSFVSLESSKLSLMEAIIMQNAERPASTTRLMALKYATLIFPRDHMASRFVVLLCAGDAREEVRGKMGYSYCMV